MTATNGWLLAAFEFAASHYHWSAEQILDGTPLVVLMLLMRQKLATEGKPGVWLSTKEMIDTMSWEDIVKQHSKAAKLATH